MKKRLLALLIAVLCICVMVCFTSCGDTNTESSTPSTENSENNGGNNNENTEPEKTTVTVGEASTGVLINLLTAKDMTIKVNLAASVGGTMAPMDTGLELEGTGYIVKNENGVYEVKADLSGTNTQYGDSYESDMELVILDGKVYLVQTDKMEGEEYKYSDVEDLDFDMNLTNLINMLLEEYNENIGTEIGLELNTQSEAMTLLSNILNALTDSAVIKKVGSNYEVTFDFDAKDTANAAAEYIKDSKEDTIDEFIVKMLSFDGITLTKEQLSQIVTNTFVAGLDFDGLIAKLEAAIKDVTGETVNIKSELEKAQATSTIKTAQIVALINLIAKSEGAESDILPAVEGEETVYEYVKRNIGADLNLDDLAKMIAGEEATLADIGEMINMYLSTLTVEDVIVAYAETQIMVDYFETSEEYEEAINEFVNQFFEIYGSIEYNACAGSFKLVVDGNLKLLSVDFALDYEMTMGEDNVECSVDFSLTVDYAKIPEGTIVAPQIEETEE